MTRTRPRKRRSDEELNGVEENAKQPEVPVPAPASEAPAPQLCTQCLRFLTMTPEQLGAYIALIAKQAVQVAWPEEITRERLAGAMKCGDQVVWIGVGCITVRRADGSFIAVYLRDS